MIRVSAPTGTQLLGGHPIQKLRPRDARSALGPTQKDAMVEILWSSLTVPLRGETSAVLLSQIPSVVFE